MLAEGASADVAHSGEDHLVIIIMINNYFIIGISFVITLPATLDIPTVFTFQRHNVLIIW